MNKYVHLCLYWVVALAVSYFIVDSKIIDYKVFVGVEFLFTFIGVLVGFALTLFTHVVGLIDKLKTKYSTISEPTEKETKINRLDKIYGEMKDDINFLFLALVLVVVVSLAAGLVKFYGADLRPSIFECLQILKSSFILSIFILCIFAIKDLISISFKLSQYTVIRD